MIRNASVGDFNWTGETLTASRIRDGQPAASGQAVCMHPVAEFVDQAGVFGERDEFRRRNHAAFGMAPAQQRLAAGHLVAREIEQRLVVDFEAAIGQSPAEDPAPW